MPAAPDQSLLLRKILGAIPHQGGIRIKPDSRAHQRLRDWISSGAPNSIEGRKELTGLAIEPAREVLAFEKRQPLKTVAHYADGSTEDVTWLAEFHANDASMATVDADGLVTIGKSIGQTAVMARYRGKVAVFQALIPRPGESSEFPQRPVQNFIDQLVDANLRRLNLHPSELASDAEYLRRAYLDIIGRLPTASEVRSFLDESQPHPAAGLQSTRPDDSTANRANPTTAVRANRVSERDSPESLQRPTANKRQQLVESLLLRPEFADYWALKWADLLRVDRLALGHRDAHAYYRWIKSAVAENTPLDQFAAQLLQAAGPMNEQPAGFFFKVGKKPGEMAAMTSQVFLGVRITCAECHQHPYDRWTQRDYHGMSAFFQQVKFKTVGDSQSLTAEGDPVAKHPRTKKPIYAYALGTTMPDASPDGDRRRALADWLTQPDNPWFARNLANRFWSYFLGRGLVEPVDDFRESNPPSNPELLDALAEYLKENKFDARALIRLITSSRTYQLSSRPNQTNAMDEKNFSRAIFRRLPAEVLMDAVSDVTDVPEKFSGVPSGYRAVQLWDSQVQHYFLKLFGRPVRATPCECERASGASISQALHLMNSPGLQAKLNHAGGRISRAVVAMDDDNDLVEDLYLTCFSRYPSHEEKAGAVQYLGTRSGQRRKATEDLVWAMMNSLEFVFNH